MKSRKYQSNSDSESNGNSVTWTKELNSIQIMYCTQEYKWNNGSGSEDDLTHINPDELISLKNKCKKEEEPLKRDVEEYTSHSVSVRKEEKF